MKKDILGIDPNTGKVIYRQDIDQLTGAMSVEHDAGSTPTLRERIRNVDSHSWVDSEVSVADLQDQLAILEARRVACYEMGNYNIAHQIEEGIARIQYILKTQTDDNLTLI